MLSAPRSIRVAILLDHLLVNDNASARELAVIANIESRQVYPTLRWWIERGIVVVHKHGSKNLYSLNDKVKKGVERILKLLFNAREVRAKNLAMKLAQEKLLRKLKPIEAEIISMLVERLLNGTSPYLRIKGTNRREALDNLLVKLEARLRRLGLGPNTIAFMLTNLESILEELNEASIIFYKFDEKNSTLILRLDIQFEKQLLTILGSLEQR